MLDLGENVPAPEHAAEAAVHHPRGSVTADLDCAISIKLTQLGLDRTSFAPRTRGASSGRGAARTLVMIDMEAGYVDPASRVPRRPGRLSPSRRVPSVLLRRTERDAFAPAAGLAGWLVKGAYLEEPDVVFESKREVDECYARSFTTLWSRDTRSTWPRTTRSDRGRGSRRRSRMAGRAEFQMPRYPSRPSEPPGARRLPGPGHIPYGTEWYPYLTRRLVERPANMWFFCPTR
jgi:proline dehydrogenase